MGNTQTISQSVKLEQLNKKVVDEYTENRKEVDINQTQINSLSAELVGVEGCTFDFSQTAQQGTEVDQEINSDVMFKSKNTVAEELKTAAAADIDAKFESWGTTWGTKSKIKSDVSTKITDIVDETWTLKNIEDVSTNQVQIQNGKYVITGMKCYEGQPTQKFTQNATQELVVKQLLQQMIDKASEDEQIRTLTTSSDSANVLDVKGTLGDAGRAISSIVGSIGDIIGGPLMSFVVFAGIALVVALGVFLMLGQSEAGQNAIRSVSGGGGGGGMPPTEF